MTPTDQITDNNGRILQNKNLFVLALICIDEECHTSSNFITRLDHTVVGAQGPLCCQLLDQ